MALKKVLWEHMKWQDAFVDDRGDVYCPVCGEVTLSHRPWGRTASKYPDRKGLLIFNCSKCGTPFLYPREVEDEVSDLR